MQTFKRTDRTVPILAAIFAVYLLSFGFRASNNFSGWRMFVMGLQAIPFLIVESKILREDHVLTFVLCWLANPTFWVGLLCALARSWRRARNMAAAALVLSLFMLLDDRGRTLLGPAYYIWLASIASLAVLAQVRWMGEQAWLPLDEEVFEEHEAKIGTALHESGDTRIRRMDTALLSHRSPRPSL
jgi:hypothetical protein